MGHSIFYLPPPKDDGFFEQGGSDFSFKEAHIFNPLEKFFKGADKKRTRVQIPVIFKNWNLPTHDQTVANNMAECSKKTTSLLIY